MERTGRPVTVIVLASGHQPATFGANGNEEDSGFLNVGTKLAIERINSFFHKKPDLTTILAVSNADKAIYQLKPFEPVQVISTGDTSNVSETLEASLSHVKSQWCLINPITAVPSSHLSTEGAVYFGQDPIPKENWSALTVPNQDRPVFHPKAERSSNGLTSHPFTGRIYAETQYIIDALASLQPEERQDLIFLGSHLIKHKQASIRYEKWIDAGHQATYAESKLYSISSRFFNSLTYIKETNTIRKQSSEATKLKLEAELISEAPAHIRRFFPAVVNSTEKGKNWEVEMEYIGYPSLAEVFLYGNAGPNTWKRIIDSLGQAYDAFYRGQCLLSENASWLYSEKTIDRKKRLDKLIESTPNHGLKPLMDKPFSVNGIELPSLSEAYTLMISACSELEARCDIHIGHGDLCFNNILVDPLFGTLKLIDPKAAIHPKTGQCGLMHGLYDLAKLNHSFVGLYDSIVNDLYRLKKEDNNALNISIYAPVNFDFISRMFQDRLLLERTDELACTQATANLFLSMLPLHQEDQERMVVLAAVGACLLLHGTIRQLLVLP